MRTPERQKRRSMQGISFTRNSPRFMPGNAVSSVAGLRDLFPPIMHYRWLQRPIIDGGGVAVELSDDADPPGDMRLMPASASGPSASISRTKYSPPITVCSGGEASKQSSALMAFRCCSGNTGMQSRCQFPCMLVASHRIPLHRTAPPMGSAHLSIHPQQGRRPPVTRKSSSLLERRASQSLVGLAEPTHGSPCAFQKAWL